MIHGCMIVQIRSYSGVRTWGNGRDMSRFIPTNTAPVGGGIVIFSDANPHLPPPQPVLVVVGDYIDRSVKWIKETLY